MPPETSLASSSVSSSVGLVSGSLFISSSSLCLPCLALDALLLRTLPAACQAQRAILVLPTAGARGRKSVPDTAPGNRVGLSRTHLAARSPPGNLANVPIHHPPHRHSIFELDGSIIHLCCKPSSTQLPPIFLRPLSRPPPLQLAGSGATALVPLPIAGGNRLRLAPCASTMPNFSSARRCRSMKLLYSSRY